MKAVTSWRQLPVGRNIVFRIGGRSYRYRVEARSPENDMLMVSMRKPHWKKRRATTFLFGIQHWIDEGNILIQSSGRQAH